MENRPTILHAYADHGTEAETLGLYGDVVRLGLEPRDTNDSTPVQGDATRPPFLDDTFEFGLFHPPCTAWSDMPDANKDGDAPELVEDARREAQRLCEHWVVENKPRAPLRDPVVLDGDMFGLPIQYERAFESNFEIPQPPRYATLGNETSSFFYSERSREWWASVKGLSPDRYTKRALCKNSLPAAYVHHIVRAWLDASCRADGPSDFAEYDERKTTEARRAENHDLEQFQKVK
jgi:hypothetical protein